MIMQAALPALCIVLGRSLLPSLISRSRLPSTRTFTYWSILTKTTLGSLTTRASNMATTETDPQPPYKVEQDSPGPTLSHYLSISFHPDKQNMSFEELRLEHYNAGHEKPTRRSRGTARLMPPSQSSAPLPHQFRLLIRAVADNTYEYAIVEKYK